MTERVQEGRNAAEAENLPIFLIHEEDKVIYLCPSDAEKKDLKKQEQPIEEHVVDFSQLESPLPWIVFKSIARRPKKLVLDHVLWYDMAPQGIITISEKYQFSTDALAAAYRLLEPESLTDAVAKLQTLLGRYGRCVEAVPSENNIQQIIGYRLNADVVVVK